MILKVPYFAQEQWWTCGPACLRMVLAGLEHEESEDFLVELCGTDFSGSTCDELAQAAESMGFASEVVENMSVHDLRNMLGDGTPLIALVDGGLLYHEIAGFGHLVVIVGLSGGDMVYHDPERGECQRVRYSRFWKAWSEFEYLGVKIWKQEKK